MRGLWLAKRCCCFFGRAAVEGRAFDVRGRQSEVDVGVGAEESLEEDIGIL
jgi:hypothetical protein